MSRAFAAHVRCLVSVFLSFVLVADAAYAVPRAPQPGLRIGPAALVRVADTDTIVSVSNGADGVVTVIAITSDEDQTELAELAPGETRDVAAPAGTVTLGFAQDGDWLGDVYVLAGTAGEAVTVPYRQPQEAAAKASPLYAIRAAQGGPGSVEVRFANTTPGLVAVVLIGEDQKAYALFGLKAGETAAHRVQPGATLWFYDAASKSPVGEPYTVTAAADVTIPLPAATGLSAAQQRQQGDGSIEAEFVNTASETVTVTVTEGGDALPLFDVAAGATVRQRVQPGAELWFYADNGKRVVNGPYVVSGLDGEVITVAPAAPALTAMQQRQRGEGSVEVAFANATDGDIVVAVIDEAAVAHPLFGLAAGQTARQRVLPKSRFYAYRRDNGERIAGPLEVTGQDGATVQIAAAAPKTPNPAVARVKRQQEGKGSVEIDFSNTLDVDVIVAVLDDGKSVPLLTVAAGQSIRQRARPGTELWFYRADTKEALAYSHTVAKTAEAVSIPIDPRAAVVAEQSGAGSSMVLFSNFLPFPVTVTVNRADGTRIGLLELPPGARGVQGRGLPGTVLSFVRTGTDRPVSDDYTVQDGFFGVDVPINATQAEQAGPGSVRVRLMNDSGMALDVVTTDRNGKRAFLFALDPGEGTGTVTRHANFLPGSTIWFLKQLTDEPVGKPFLVPDGDGAAINLPYQPNAVAQAQMGEGSVEITFANASADAAAVTVVDAKEQHVTLVTIPAGHAITTRAMPKSVLWFYKGSSEEKLGQDLPYIVGEASGQRVDLPWNPTDDQVLAMTNISIDKIIADFASKQAQQSALSDGPQFCWKDSYGRGVGTVPRKCEPGFSEDTAGLCWPNAKPGYVCDFFVCRQAGCPAGYRDDGLTCFKPEPYKRDEYPVSAEEAAKVAGDGLAWFFSFGTYKASGETGLDGARRRCREAHGDNCVNANGDTIVYETCKAGYEQAPVITNLCTPSCPAPMTDGGIFCAKHTYTREASLMSCDAGAVNDAGLCYQGCKSGFAGVGPVCWNACPAKLPHNCGAGCAVDKATCDGAIVDQVLSPVIAVGSIALTVLTAGGSTGATAGAKAGATAAKTGGAVAAKMAAREGFKATLKAGVKEALKAGLKTVGKELVVDGAIGGALSTVIWGGTTIAAQVKMRNALKEMIRNKVVGSISDERVDAVVETMMAGAEAKNPAADFPWSSLDPTGIADIVIAYNYPVCADVK